MQSSTNSTSAVGTANVNAINNAIITLGTPIGEQSSWNNHQKGTYFINAAITLGDSDNAIRFVGGSGQQNFGGSLVQILGGAVLQK